MSAPVAVVRNRLIAHGLADTIREFPDSTHTATEAAQAVGCNVAQIAKSIVFEANRKPMIVVAAGSNRVDKSMVSRAIGAKLHSVGADYLRDNLGLEPGGVTPLATNAEIATIIDITLLEFDLIWIGAGTPRHVLSVTAQDLAELTKANVMAICEKPANP
jgi:prolyl-tRNA editing enzyme YbaK/EbsC (Cys-tRNA(Pro) deacylase)